MYVINVMIYTMQHEGKMITLCKVKFKMCSGKDKTS